MVTLVNICFRIDETIYYISHHQNKTKKQEKSMWDNMFLTLYLAGHFIAYTDIKTTCYLS